MCICVIQVQEAMYKNLRGRSVVIIAHRLSTVEKADKIVFINKGEVVEQGAHAELLQKGGKYAKLVQRQLLGMDIGIPDDLSMGPVKPGGAAAASSDSPRHRTKKKDTDDVSYGSFHSLREPDYAVEIVRGSRQSPLEVCESPTFGTPKFMVGSVGSNC